MAIKNVYAKYIGKTVDGWRNNGVVFSPRINGKEYLVYTTDLKVTTLVDDDGSILNVNTKDIEILK